MSVSEPLEPQRPVGFCALFDLLTYTRDYFSELARFFRGDTAKKSRGLLSGAHWAAEHPTLLPSFTSKITPKEEKLLNETIHAGLFKSGVATVKLRSWVCWLCTFCPRAAAGGHVFWRMWRFVGVKTIKVCMHSCNYAWLTSCDILLSAFSRPPSVTHSTDVQPEHHDEFQASCTTLTAFNHWEKKSRKRTHSLSSSALTPPYLPLSSSLLQSPECLFAVGCTRRRRRRRACVAERWDERCSVLRTGSPNNGARLPRWWRRGRSGAGTRRSTAAPYSPLSEIMFDFFLLVSLALFSGLFPCAEPSTWSDNDKGKNSFSPGMRSQIKLGSRRKGWNNSICTVRKITNNLRISSIPIICVFPVSECYGVMPSCSAPH